MGIKISLGLGHFDIYMFAFAEYLRKNITKILCKIMQGMLTTPRLYLIIFPLYLPMKSYKLFEINIQKPLSITLCTCCNGRTGETPLHCSELGIT